MLSDVTTRPTFLDQCARSGATLGVPLECGGIDTALACPLVAKAASKPPHSIKWRRFAHGHVGVFALLAALFLLTPAAFAQTQPAEQTPMVEATTGFDGNWMRQQWAPLRLTFHDPGPVSEVYIFCNDAGPVFRAVGVPAPVGNSLLDVAVYPQIASTRWTVRLVRPTGPPTESAIELKAYFACWEGWLGPFELSSNDPAFRSPPRQMLLAAARVGSVFEKCTNGDVGFLATGRPMRVFRELDGGTTFPAPPIAEFDLTDVFGPPDDSPLTGPAGQPTLFEQHVWTNDLASPPDQPIKLALALLAGAALAIMAIAILLRRHWRSASVLGILVLAGVAVAIWPTQPARLAARLELVIHAGRPVEKDDESKPLPAPLPAPVRRQQWQCLAAYRAGEFDLPATNPTPRILVRASEDRPAIVLPAAFTTQSAPAGLPTPGRATLARGQRIVGTTVEYQTDAGRIDLRDGKLVWQDWHVPLSPAWLVADTRATPIGAIAGEKGEIALPGPDRQVAWDAAFTASPADSLATQLAKRMLAYWTTSVVHGGRLWLVGFDPSPGSEPGVLIVPALHVIDLGPIAAQ